MVEVYATGLGSRASCFSFMDRDDCDKGNGEWLDEPQTGFRKSD